jgi:formiminotetrahydrofolate cyclodeaminase
VVANRNAAEVPLRTAQAAVRLLAALPELAEKGNPNAVSDVGSAALLLDACVEGALLNVGINLGGIEDSAFVAEMQRETAVLQGESQRLRSQVVALVRKRF